MRDSAKLLYTQTASDVFALLMPFSSYWRIGKWTFSGIAEIYVVPVFHLPDLALAAFLVTGVFSVYRKGRPGRRAYLFTAPLLCLSCLAVLTTPFALNPRLAAYTALRWWAAVAVSLCLLQGHIHIQRFVKVFLIGLLVHVLVGMGQVLLQKPLGLPGEMALPLTQSGAAIVALSDQNWLRAYGLTFHPNILGGYLVVGLLLGMPLLSRAFGWLVVWWMLWGGLLLTFSRSAALAALLTVPITAGWIFWKQPSQRRSLRIALAGVALIAVAGGAIFSEQLAARLEVGHVTEWLSLRERQAQLQVVLGILAAKPLGGVGAGNFPLAVPLSGLELRALPVHNVPLLLASEVGVFGGAIWIWTLFVAIVLLLMQWGRSPIRCSHGQNIWAVAGLCAWLALWLVGLFDYYPWGLNTGRLLSATVLGLTGCAILDEHYVEG